MQAEISYDLVMEDDMAFVEGTYRLPNGRWQVFIFSRGEVLEPQTEPGTWDGGITGVFVRFPQAGKLAKKNVEQVLGQALGIEEWVEVRGPDSMRLR